MFEEDSASGSESFGGTNNGSGIPGILNAVKNYKQRGMNLEIPPFPNARPGKSHYALRGLRSGKRGKRACRNDYCFNAMFARIRFPGDKSFGREEECFQLPVTPDHFLEQVRSFNDKQSVTSRAAAGCRYPYILEKGIPGAAEFDDSEGHRGKS